VVSLVPEVFRVVSQELEVFRVVSRELEVYRGAFRERVVFLARTIWIQSKVQSSSFKYFSQK
jgi:hypothetical protein